MTPLAQVIWLVGGIIACVVFVIVCSAAGGVIHRRRLRRKTGGLSRDRFVSKLEARAVDPSVAGAVYDHYKKDSEVPDYLVSPKDEVDEDYWLVDEDLEDDLAEIVRECSLELPPEDARREWSKPLRTVEDVVLWVDWVRRRQQ